ncbi:MAG: hypothetical protein R2749_25335 [Acidimicrobiales bacterium]
MLPRPGAGTDGAARRSSAAGSRTGRWAETGRMAPARIAGGYALLATVWLLVFHGGRSELVDAARGRGPGVRRHHRQRAVVGAVPAGPGHRRP